MVLGFWKQVVNTMTDPINTNNVEQTILNKFKLQQFRANELRLKRFSGWTECFPMTLLPQLLEELV